MGGQIQDICYLQCYIYAGFIFFPSIKQSGVAICFQLPGMVHTHGFQGCMGGVRVDGQDIGLFNFAKLYGHGCDGCADV